MGAIETGTQNSQSELEAEPLGRARRGSTHLALGLLEKGGRNADLSEVTAVSAYQRRAQEGGAEDWKNEPN